MASEEFDQKNAIAELTNQAIQEYEGLQRRHEAATQERKILEEERDEAIKRLDAFQQVSTMVIDEINAIQEQLEMERACRGSAEALASELNKQNRALKRQSAMLLSQLSPATVSEINLEDDVEESDEFNVANCLSTTCQTKSSAAESIAVDAREKDHVGENLAMLKDQLEGTRQELLEEKRANAVLMAETAQQKKLLRKYHRVSKLAVEEFETLQDDLNLERGLREGAETFARAMVVEQKMLKRQSQIVIQSTTPSHALQEALGQVTTLTKDLETLKQEHQSQIKKLEEKFSRCETQKELTALRCQLELVEEEKRERGDECSKARAEVKDLRFAVQELQKKLETAPDPSHLPVPPCPPPPPPPPPPPLPTLAAFNPLSSLLSLIRKRQNSSDIPLAVHNSDKRAEVDVRQQAVEEMMNRIKKGVQLRPVTQKPTNEGQMAKKPSNSAFRELKAIMGNLDTSVSSATQVSSSSPDGELLKILMRRRDVLEGTNAS